MIKSLNKSDKKMKKKGSKIGKIILSTFVIIVILIIGGLFYLKNYYDTQMLPVAKTDIKVIDVEIPQGSSTTKIAQILFENGLIRDELVFRVNSKLLGMDGTLKAGMYTLSNGLTPEEILQALQKGGITRATTKFTIPEGFELDEIAERLSSMGLVDVDKFIDLTSTPDNFVSDYPFLEMVPQDLNLEGYLYPDTYEVFVDSNEEEIIKRMIDRFEEVYDELIRDKANELDMTLNEIITLASIVEREGMLDEERPIISAVFHNRLDINQPLQSCATVQYALGERKERLFDKDLEIDSLYNTYLYQGLPPGPIASPGYESIKAAVNPSDVDYLFFVSNGDGSHTFNKTYKGHLEAIERNK